MNTAKPRYEGYKKLSEMQTFPNHVWKDSQPSRLLYK